MPKTKAMKKAHRAMMRSYRRKGKTKKEAESIYQGWEANEKAGRPHGRGKKAKPKKRKRAKR